MAKSNCQYGKNCFRQNTNHFMEYNHEHLDKIINETTPENIEQYIFPDDLLLNKDIFLEQISIIRGLNSENVSPDDSTLQENVLNPEVVEDRKPDIQSLQANIIQSNLPCTPSSVKQEIGRVAIKQEPDAIKIKQEPTFFDHAPFVIKVEPNDDNQSNNRNMHEILAAASPYNYFLTTIDSSPQTHTEPLSISFQEIFDQSLGDLECSMQINFLVDPEWLFDQYDTAGHLNKPMLLLYGDSTSPMSEHVENMPQIQARLINTNNGYGCHHTKLMLLGYKDKSMRIVVSTANLYENDWRNHVQGLWISDRLPPSNPMHYLVTDSHTNFRKDLLSYLSEYKLCDLEPWLSRIRATDFSSINVFLITSVPGMHRGTSYGLARVKSLLLNHTPNIYGDCPIIAQCSTMGKMEHWLREDFIKSFQCHSRQSGNEPPPDFKLIYPTLDNVLNSHDGIMGAGCLLYGQAMHEMQPWLTTHMYQWRAEKRFRTKSMPHAKTYARMSGNTLYWFILTSANLSKSAWGSFHRNRKKGYRMNNYEAGVMFLPKFVTNTEYFSMCPFDKTTPVFPWFYDLPLMKYDEGDVPYVAEYAELQDID